MAATAKKESDNLLPISDESLHLSRSNRSSASVWRNKGISPLVVLSIAAGVIFVGSSVFIFSHHDTSQISFHEVILNLNEISSYQGELLSVKLARAQKLEQGYFSPKDETEQELLFNDFAERFSKTYESDDEKKMRLEVFKQNLEVIDRLNAEMDSAWFGITPFTDWSEEEFDSYNNLKMGDFDVPNDPDMARKWSDEYESNYGYGGEDLEDEGLDISPAPDGMVDGGDNKKKSSPDSFDWRDHGAVAPVRYQGRCGSCWAISTAEDIEGHLAAKTGKPVVPLSAQQLVSCDKTSWGCIGGYIDKAFEYIMGSPLLSEEEYPYDEKDPHISCRLNANNTLVGANDTDYAVTIEGYDVLPLEFDAAWLKHSVWKTGPHIVPVIAHGLQFYKGGVFDGTDHCYGNYDHAVVLVGWGVDEQQTQGTSLDTEERRMRESSMRLSTIRAGRLLEGDDTDVLSKKKGKSDDVHARPYWIIKNSWGTKWGEDGFFRIYAENSTTACGIGKVAFHSVDPHEARELET
mmetsp:Transcript_15903/g.23380  ORF Transcript_15903/g.23380 Transcript_15903/m.23380 type:complete len:519 (-) Transcript_15903:120-1676(-)